MILLAACATLPGPAALDRADAAVGDRTYCNARFGYCITYPTRLLVAGREADNGDGRPLRGRDRRVTGAVFGANEADPFATITAGYRAAIAEIRAKRGRVTRRERARGRYVVSGLIDGGRTVVFTTGRRELVRRSPVIQTFTIRYPVARRGLWGPVVTRMAASFR